MNLDVLRLNDGILYAMSSAIYSLKYITYIKNNRKHHYNIIVYTRVGEVRINPNDIIVNKIIPISNGISSVLWLIFAYECDKKEVFVWL